MVRARGGVLTVNPSHLLNVRVANMSAFPDDPAHFLLWLWRFDYHVDGLPIPPSGHAFVPRGVYGSYLEDTLIAARKAAAPRVECEMRTLEAVGIRRWANQYVLSFRDAAPMTLDHVVLCIGNLAPALPCKAAGALDYPRYIADPWHEPGLTEIAPDAPVAIIGTGLTAVDVVLSLLDQKSPRPDHGAVASRPHSQPARTHAPLSRLPGGRAGTRQRSATFRAAARRDPRG